MAKDAEVTKEAKAVIKEQKEAEKKKTEETKQPAEKKAAETTAKKEESKKEKKEEQKKDKKKEEKVLEEKIYTFNLKEAWKAPRQKRARAAVKVLKNLIKRHTKKEPKLHETMNHEMWKNSARNPPRKVKIKVKITETTATAYPMKQ